MAEQKKILSGCTPGPGPSGEIIAARENPVTGVTEVRPLTFMGATVLSFSASLGIGPTEESTLDVELIEDCATDASTRFNPDGDYFLGNIRLGSPVFFNACEAMGIDIDAEYGGDIDKAPCFHFGGFVENYTAKQGSNGLTFNVKVVDPRKLLNSVTVVCSNLLSGPIKHRNYYNAYAYYERAVLKPERRDEPRNNPPEGYTILGTRADDEAVDYAGSKTSADCSVFGDANVDDRGMTYAQIIHAINHMNPLVYSPNYAQKHDPPLAGRDLEIATFENTVWHQNNVFNLDLSGLPDPPKYLRAPGPDLTIMELISTVCESRGMDFMVTLEENGTLFNNNLLPIIKIKTKKVGAVDNVSFKSAIMKYNGRSVDLSYGKEIRTDPTRTMMIGEQRHVMAETTRVEMWFGYDKEGNPIIPYRDTQDETTLCGWNIDIYIDDLNNELRCPLYECEAVDSGVEGEEPTRPIVTRKVTLNEFHIRTVLTSYKLWHEYVWNIDNDEDLSALIRCNFPEYAAYARKNLLNEFEASIDAVMNPAATGQGVVPKSGEFTIEGVWRSINDAVQTYTLQATAMILAQQQVELKKIYDFIANLARSHYGRTYLATISEGVCTKLEGLDDINYFGTDGKSPPVNRDSTVFIDPCSGVETNISNKVLRKKLLSHTPTNDGAWIEQCGTVLGLGDFKPGADKNLYLDFFRTQDGRVGPFARIDSKVFARLFDVESLIDDALDYIEDIFATTPIPETTTSALAFPVGTLGSPGQGKRFLPASWFQTMYEFIVSAADSELWNEILDATNALLIRRFYTGICGELDSSKLNENDFVVIRDFGICKPPDPQGESFYAALDFPSSFFVKFRVEEDIIVTQETVTRIDKPRIPSSATSDDPCCGKYQNNDPYHHLADCYMSGATDAEVAKANLDCLGGDAGDNLGAGEIETEETKEVYKIPITFNAPLLQKPCDRVKGEKDRIGSIAQIEGVFEPKPEKPNRGVRVDSAAAIDYTINPDTPVPNAPPADNMDKKVRPSFVNCEDIEPDVADIVVASMDYTSINNENDFYPAAHIPDAVAIPLKSNIDAYGPWYSENFDINSGGITFKQDPDFCPWVFDSASAMNTFAKDIIKEEQINLTELETGSINYPYWPEISLGFLENGPNLTRVYVSMGSNGVNTTYTFQSYTPQFAKIKTLEKQALIQGIRNKNKLRQLAREKERKLDVLRRKDVSGGGVGLGVDVPVVPEAISKQGTLDRVILGEIYDFSLIKETEPTTATYEEYVDPCCGKYTFLNLEDECYNSDPTMNDICDSGTISITVTGYEVQTTGERTVIGTTTLAKSTLELRYKYENKAFMSWDGLLSPISISGNAGLPRFIIPDSGLTSDNGVIITNKFLNPLTNPASWHYHSGVSPGHVIDIVGRGTGIPDRGIITNFYPNSKPEEKYSDDYRFIGLKGPLVLHSWGYDTDGMPIPNENDILSDIKAGVFTKDVTPRFFQNWLQKPTSWPVGPIDLRFDKKRGVWVTPSQEGSAIKIGKFCNQWPSLSNVKDPANAIKKVVLYQQSANCDSYGTTAAGDCPWALEPVMTKISGVDVPVVVEAINLFSNVAAHEYQTKWCAIAKNGGNYYLLAAEC